MSRTVQAIAERLRDEIRRGKFIGGSRMNEVELASAFGVSRTPIRSALSSIANEGLLEHTPNAGYVVRTYSSKDMQGVFEARAVLEGLAARQAVEHGLSDEHRKRMQTMLQEGEALLKTEFWRDEGAPRWARINAQFHAPVVEASQNEHLSWLLQKSRHIPLVHATLYRVFDAVDVGRIANAHEEHIRILEALTDRQAVRAEALAREHVYRAGQFVVERMRREEFESAKSAKKKRRRSAAKEAPVNDLVCLDID